jgi:hypothetical protein
VDGAEWNTADMRARHTRSTLARGRVAFPGSTSRTCSATGDSLVRVSTGNHATSLFPGASSPTSCELRSSFSRVVDLPLNPLSAAGCDVRGDHRVRVFPE